MCIDRDIISRVTSQRSLASTTVPEGIPISSQLAVTEYRHGPRFTRSKATLCPERGPAQICSKNETKKIPIFQSKYRLSVEIDKYLHRNFFFSDFFSEILIFPCFFLLFFGSKNLKKNAFERFRTHSKCLKVAPFNHRAIDCTYYI